MKFIATLATIATSITAITLSVDADVDIASEAAQGYAGPIVPEDFYYAVHDFDLAAPFTDQEQYQKQVDIYSDQIIAIEALRLEVLQLTRRITLAEHDYVNNADEIAANKSRIFTNNDDAIRNQAEIDVLFLDVNDVAQCLHR
jgi:hypothetical protein